MTRTIERPTLRMTQKQNFNITGTGGKVQNKPVIHLQTAMSGKSEKDIAVPKMLKLPVKKKKTAKKRAKK